MSDGELTVGCEFESPALFVDEVMMSRAQREQVVEVGASAELPGDQVVDLAALEWCFAAGEGAGAVDGAQGAALGAVGEALLASDVDRHAVDEDDRHDPPAAAQTPEHVGWQDRSAVGFADTVVVEFAVVAFG